MGMSSSYIAHRKIDTGFGAINQNSREDSEISKRDAGFREHEDPKAGTVSHS